MQSCGLPCQSGLLSAEKSSAPGGPAVRSSHLTPNSVCNKLWIIIFSGSPKNPTLSTLNSPIEITVMQLDQLIQIAMPSNRCDTKEVNYYISLWAKVDHCPPRSGMFTSLASSHVTRDWLDLLRCHHRCLCTLSAFISLMTRVTMAMMKEDFHPLT